MALFRPKNDALRISGQKNEVAVRLMRDPKAEAGVRSEAGVKIKGHKTRYHNPIFSKNKKNSELNRDLRLP